MKHTFVLAALFFIPSCASALTFTEVMYDLSGTDEGREWVEVYNDGDTSLDLSGYKFNDGANHVLNPPPENGGQGNMVLPQGEYMVIASNAATFLSEHPGFAGTVVDTVMSLANTGDSLSVVSGSGVVLATFSYVTESGGAGNGWSIQKIDGDWVESEPSPGLPGTLSSSPPGSDEEADANQNESDDEEDTISSSETAESDATEKQKIAELRKKFSIDLSQIPKTAVAGNYVKMGAVVKNAYGEGYKTGRFLWYFGDGSWQEMDSDDPIFHAYAHPGEYVVTLEFYKKNHVNGDPEKAMRKTITIASPSLVIDSVDESGSVTFVNESTEERDIGGFMLESSRGSFTFPKHTVLFPKKRFVLGVNMSGMQIPSQDMVVLRNASREVVAVYPARADAPVARAPTSLPARAASPSSPEPSPPPTDTPLPEEPPKEQKNRTHILALVGIIILGGGALVSARKFRTKEEVADDDRIEDDI